MDVVASVQSANKAQKKWQELSTQERVLLLQKWIVLIEKELELLVQFDHEDSGISLESSKILCANAIQQFKSFLNYSPKIQADATHFQVLSPVGIVGLITDWQQSFLILLENLAASLCCGNLVIIYPSEFAMRSALKITELSVEAGIPAGVLGVLLGRGEELAIHLCEHPGIKHLRFYGDNALGEKLHKIAVENQKRIVSYMGVNNAAIVFSDAEARASVQTILELSFNFHLHGRNRVNRVLIQEKFLNEFKTEFDLQIEKLDSEKIGPLPDPSLKEKFAAYLEQSKKDRAKIHTSKSGSVPLTVYDDLTNCSTLHQQNLSGPILFLQSFKYAADLPKVLNSGSFAYRAYVWTNDLARIHKLSQQLEVSQILFNPKEFAEPNLSSENLKQSGYGHNGMQSLFEFNLNRRVISLS